MIQEIEISRLNEAAYNPRIALKPGDAEWESLKNSIEQFGYIKPIVWNAQTGNVVGGHQRLAVLKALGWECVPCSVVDISLEEEKLLNVALNKIKGRWDYDKLGELVKDLDKGILEKTSGFTAAELVLLESSNDDILDDEDWEDWTYESELPKGMSYVVTLVFDNWRLAQEWAESEGYEGYVKEGKGSTVIRIDGEETDDGEAESESE